MTKSDDPHRRIGVYKSLDQVPDHALLENHSRAYEGRDVWTEYLQAQLADISETVRYETELVETAWKNHMQQRGRHHALARPEDVELWFSDLLDRMQPKRAYNPYWVRVADFYDHLMWHVDYPHTYHPPRMAAGQGGFASEVWDAKLRSR